MVSILPPFNVLHALVIKKGTSSAAPAILTSSSVNAVYSAASNPNDPALQNPVPTSVYKTNFWDTNPSTGNSLAFDGYDPFLSAKYPESICNDSRLRAARS